MRQPEAATLFLDRCLGKQTIASALRGAGFLVEVHEDHFAPDARDEDWLAEVGERGWIVLTKDKRFRNRDLETSAIARSNVAVFTLTTGGIQGKEMAKIFVKACVKMINVSRSHHRPFIATVSRTGRVTIALSASRLKRYR